MRASKRTTRHAERTLRRAGVVGDLSSVRTWRRRNDDPPRVAPVATRPLLAAAPSSKVSDSTRESQTSRENHPAVGLLQASGLVVLVCAGALAIFAGWGRTDLVQLAAIFAVVGIGLVVASLWKPSSPADTAPPEDKASQSPVRPRRSLSPPWAALDQRVQRLVSRLEEAFEK